jgi:hypothetical protein
MLILMAMGKTVVSRIIAKIDDTDVSHVALASPDICDGQIVFHSGISGVEMVSRHTFNNHYDVKRIYKVQSKYGISDSELLWGLLKSYEDAEYDYLATLYAGLWLLAKKMGIKLNRRNLWNNSNHYMCLEFAYRGLYNRDALNVVSLKGFENLLLEEASRGHISFY